MYKEKAQEIVDQYKPFVYCFTGSGMLVNQEDELIILRNAQICAKINIKNIVDALLQTEDGGDFGYWINVNKAIDETV